MLRPPLITLGIAAAAIVLAAGVACSSGGSKAPPPPVAPTSQPTVLPTITPDARPRPASVPEAATQALGSAQYGDPAPAGSETLTSTRCADGVLEIATSARTVYAELPCDRALPPDVAARFVGHPVRVRVVPQGASKLYLESQAGGSAEFTVGRVWVQGK